MTTYLGITPVNCRSWLASEGGLPGAEKSELPHLGIHKKRPRIIFQTPQVIPTLLHDQARAPEVANSLAEHGKPFAGHRHFALRVQLLWPLPSENGVVDFDIHLLWNREQKMSQAETLFLESFQHMLSIREPVL